MLEKEIIEESGKGGDKKGEAGKLLLKKDRRSEACEAGTEEG